MKYEFVYDSEYGHRLSKLESIIALGYEVGGWEKQFVEGIRYYWNTFGRLTTSQADKLDEVYGRYTHVFETHGANL